jgi:hypothetical protein
MGVVLDEKAEVTRVENDYWHTETSRLNCEYAHLLKG